MTRPLTVFVTAHAPATAPFGRWQAQDLFPMLDEFSTAPLELVETEADAQFIIEAISTPSEGVTSVLMRESIVVMAAAPIAADDGLKVQQSIARRFAKMIDTAAECYAAPSSVAVPA